MTFFDFTIHPTVGIIKQKFTEDYVRWYPKKRFWHFLTIILSVNKSLPIVWFTLNIVISYCYNIYIFIKITYFYAILLKSHIEMCDFFVLVFGSRIDVLSYNNRDFLELGFWKGQFLAIAKWIFDLCCDWFFIYTHRQMINNCGNGWDPIEKWWKLSLIFSGNG